MIDTPSVQCRATTLPLPGGASGKVRESGPLTLP
jgi:hypothetical protein